MAMNTAAGSKLQAPGHDLQLAACSLQPTRGQSAIEYAVLIAVTVAALAGMSVYMKRALNGKWRQVGDTFGFGRQYERCVTLIDGAKEPGC